VRGRGSGMLPTYLWMVGLQTGVGVLCLTVAVARLRPVFRAQGDVSRWATRIGLLKQGRRLLPRPACGDDPMLWKERYVSRTSVVTKLVGGVIVLVLGGVFLYSAYDWVLPAYQEVITYGYGSVTQHMGRDALNRFVRLLTGFTYTAWVLGIASAASSGIVYEREADTWTSLVATPLDGLEIVRAKLIGAIWGTRWIGAFLLFLFTLGLTSGAVHLLGFMAGVVETVVFVWFAAALGTFISLRAKNSGRAMTATVGILVFLNGGYTLCCIPLRPDTMFIAVGVTPLLESVSLVTYEDLHRLFRSGASDYVSRRDIELFMACVVGTIAYGIAALVLTVSSVSLFDDVAERPRRYGQYPPFRPPLEEATQDDQIEFID